MDWCNGVGFLIIVTGIVYWSLIYYHVLKRFFGKMFVRSIAEPIGKLWDKCWKNVFFKIVFTLVILGGLITFLILDTKDNRRRLISASGIPILLCIGVILSKHPARIVWRHIFWGTALQFIFGLLILRWEFGKNLVSCVSDKVKVFLDFTNEGSEFVYGYLAVGFVSEDPKFELPNTFAFGVLSTIFWFSFMVAILYSLGAMTWIVVKIGWLLQISVGTTAAESMSASANIFLGQTEAPLVVKPFIKDMTNSELHAILTGGFATIAGTVLGAFISFGISPSHLLSASFMSAPAALAFSKLIYPESKVSKTTSEKIYEHKQEKSGNILNAASEATSQAVFLVLNIIASLIAITAFVAFLDAVVSWFAILVGQQEINFQWILAKLFYPIAFIIGIDPDDLDEVSKLLGVKTVVNEFVAYIELGELTRQNLISERSTTIATYALCSFSNFSSIGIQLGGLGALVPERRKDMAKIIWRAFIAGNAAALMTACIAGTLT
jgi:pyrimidine nucleoside transport protein